MSNSQGHKATYMGELGFQANKCDSKAHVLTHTLHFFSNSVGDSETHKYS